MKKGIRIISSKSLEELERRNEEMRKDNTEELGYNDLHGLVAESQREKLKERTIPSFAVRYGMKDDEVAKMIYGESNKESIELLKKARKEFIREYHKDVGSSAQSTVVALKLIEQGIEEQKKNKRKTKGRKKNKAEEEKGKIE